MSEERIVINGGRRLYGNVEVHGAKNAVLPLLAASILTTDEVVIDNCPYITDVDFMVKLLADLGLKIARDGRRISVCGSVTHSRAGENANGSEKLYTAMRSSMVMVGALLRGTGEVEMPMPGGCDLGA